MKVELPVSKVIRVGDTQTFDSGFQKREVVLEIESGDYPNQVPVEAVKDKCTFLDGIEAGDEVECSAFLNGNYWEKGDRYFIALRMAYIKKVGESATKGEVLPDDGLSKESEDRPF